MIKFRSFFVHPHALVFLTCCLLAIIEVSPQTEKEILLQFKGNITEDPYDSLASWVPSVDHCLNFSGVVCNSAGFVDKIVLWNTSLVGVLSPALAGLRYLRVLTLFGNRFNGNIPQEYAGLLTLWKINVSSNALSGSIPGFIGDLPNIRFLDFSRNGYGGMIPESLFKLCYKTKFVALSHNSLSGSVPASIANCINIEGFDFSYNNLSGSIPPQIFNIPRLRYLSFRGNVLSGSVPKEIVNCQNLDLLDLGSNSLTGLAPFGVLGFENLTYYNVSHNKFQGQIRVNGACSTRMGIFDVSWNGLDGEIPSSISSCKNLKVLDLGFNKLNGNIPAEIWEMKRLLVIRLASNSLHGTIPAEVGTIELLQVLDLHNLNLVGKIPRNISHCRFLLELDVSGNALEGDIPQTLYNMTYLEMLNLHRNRLNESIPPSLGNLSKLRFLDLSQNFLSGSIPYSLGKLSQLTRFNLSFNNLTGSIPSLPSIQRFGPSAFFNNPGLCGAPLAPCSVNGPGAAPLPRKPKKLSVSAILVIVAAAVIFVGVCVVCFMNINARKRKGGDETSVTESTPLASMDSNVIIGKLVLFSKSLPSKYEDWEAGTKALLDKDSIIGGGSIGTVYKTDFEGGVSIAVKKLETLGRIRNQDEFEQEIGRLGSIRHPNLVTIQGYYWSSTMQLILTEYVPKGNLYDNLHRQNYAGTSTDVGNREMYWSRRFSIAVGTARALAYLHHDCRPAILHLNLKSANILLDDNYEAKLSDYGLKKLLPILNHVGLTKFNAMGYIAPELSQSLSLSEKCDVYSFGVILLELVTGRRPVESPTTNEVVVLCEYVRVLLESGTTSECFDKRLRGFAAENELIQVMRLGLICTSETPTRRPSMAEVVQVLESIRNGLGS